MGDDPIVSDARRIHGREARDILSQAAVDRCVVQLLMGGEPPLCVSRIHNVVFQGIARIDIHPFGLAELDRRMDAGPSVMVTMIVDDLPYRFTVRSIGPCTNVHLHSLEIPKTIEVVQRRAHFRLEPPTSDALDLRIRYHAEESFRAVEPLNVSVGGTLIYDRALASAPDETQRIDLHLHFDTGARFAFDGQVRHVGAHAGRKRGLQVGVQFDALTRTEEEAIGRIIMRWQREVRRREIGE